jgi:hypothetical protein
MFGYTVQFVYSHLYELKKIAWLETHVLTACFLNPGMQLAFYST